MIVIEYLNKKVEKKYSALIVNGHSKNVIVCNIISLIMKNFEIACVESNIDYKFNCPKPGKYEIFFKDLNEKFEFFLNVFLKNLDWLKKQFDKDILLKKE